jgi:hypothetical protein
MRAFAIIAVAAVAVAAGTAGLAGAAGSSSHTAITVTFWESGQRSSADPDVWTLRCDPARGSLPNPSVACKRIEAGGWRLVAPVPASAICTQIYGGPQVARVVGFLEGRRVWARFTRENGCQIGRWNRLSPWLLPAGGVK